MSSEQGEGTNSHTEKLYLNSKATYMPILFWQVSEHLTFTFLMVFCKTIILFIILVPVFTENEVYT